MTTLDLTPPVLDLAIMQGDDYLDLLVVVPKDDLGVPIDLTGYSAGCDVTRRGMTSPIAMAVTVGSDITAGLTSTQTTAMSATTYTYDLAWVDPSGHKLTLLTGMITVKAQVTT